MELLQLNMLMDPSQQMDSNQAHLEYLQRVFHENAKFYLTLKKTIIYKLLPAIESSHSSQVSDKTGPSFIRSKTL